MPNDPNVYKSPVRAIGNVEEDAATNSTDAWSIVALLKGLYRVLTVSGITVTGGTLATSAKQDTQQTTLTAIDGHVDGLETLNTAGNVSLASIDSKLTTLNFSTDTLESALGIVTETAPASDTASSGLNGRLQRVAQRLTSLIALVPASLGAKTAAGSFSVTTATDDNSIALMGAVNETAPASDTASSGQNGRLQRIAQRLTSLIALLPASLGAKTAAASFAVTTATDDAVIALNGAVSETAPATDTASSGHNGRLQRIAQRITSLIALVPAALTGSGNFKVAVQEALPTGTNVIGTVSIKDISNGEYETVAASTTAQAIGATGATGDFIAGLLIIPATTSPGQVLLLDNATSITIFTGGTTSVSNLVPFFVPLGMISVSGAWKVTTGASVSVIAVGNFT